MTRLCISLLSGSIVRYPIGGGHLSVHLQYVLGLHDLGHQVNWIAPVAKSGNPAVDRRRIKVFLRRVKYLGLEGRAAVLLFDWNDRPVTLENCSIHGVDRRTLCRLVRGTDLALNFCHSLTGPMLEMFSRTALIDLDPGHLQIGGEAAGGGIQDHDSYFTVGLNMHGEDCTAPYVNRHWYPFAPPVYLPMWQTDSAPPADAPLTSVTQWTWESLSWNNELLSVSKRDAYLRFVEAPDLCAVPFELAANIGSNDTTGDKELLSKHHWRLADPHCVARSPAHYRTYIRSSLGEFGCAKPIHLALRTGWFSDRTGVYLASSRPAIVEDTGISRHVPTGEGLLVFRDAAGIKRAAEELQSDWQKHSKAARDFAYSFLDHRRVLPALLETCFCS